MDLINRNNFIKIFTRIIYPFNNFLGEKMEVAEQILSTMKKENKPLSAGQIAEISGIERKEIDKAMKKLKTEGKITSPKNCYWEPAK